MIALKYEIFKENLTKDAQFLHTKLQNMTDRKKEYLNKKLGIFCLCIGTLFLIHQFPNNHNID